MDNETYCAFCGRLSHRCNCQEPDSDIARFLARGGRAYLPRQRSHPPQWAVPPQVKRRERKTLRKHFKEWYACLSTKGELCANCGATEELVLDHILPISKGGHSQLDNLQLLCATCNRIKGKLIIDCRDLNRPK